jgi:hypothetical protein
MTNRDANFPASARRAGVQSMRPSTVTLPI